MPRQANSLRLITFFLGLPLLFGSVALAIALLIYGLVIFLPIPLGLFLLGLVLVWVGMPPWWLKLPGALLAAGMPILLFYFWTRPPHYEGAVVLIPVGFRGEVAIVQNEPCGPALLRLDGKLTIVVPPSGLVVTSSSLDEHLLEASLYYLVNAQGERVDTIQQLEEVHEHGSIRRAIAPQQVCVVLNSLQFSLPLNLGYVPDEANPDPTAPPIEKVAYNSFTVACPDSFASQHMSPGLSQKLHLGLDVPAGCDRLRRSR